jgi:hypothetical protein
MTYLVVINLQALATSMRSINAAPRCLAALKGNRKNPKGSRSCLLRYPFENLQSIFSKAIVEVN